ncbi:MAG TPA: prepilin-type N-terminal cleavage/methylation domain-containing protein [Phycisphaerae bacterium]|nr:prepilin-type N-terminal cleavage/methylation domain-containing protein [Phycisphaerae bacterium]HOJ73731.1 prepilin-type N-terminal cleavage/methylation domain-containing protein [Phycisphaerae bacterium]HOM50378.1 prepilin-type N-terminal cleavage/methylation domain-containing protein [Phycisphaerae bacterium]HON66296.1 prepilin-type N-terminal cleavage/methylation domain-containing protein [Phycisphaerae bacterium]HOQ84210.1 prepilin-type N-terminal cleavage/methylation domain-containing 
MSSKPHTRIGGRRPLRANAFTLIEVLVVVAIIALLAAILMPSLAAARNMAKLTVDKANCKQIATMTAEYQTDFKSYVPIIYNYYANGSPNHEAPARACWASVALRNYFPSLRNLKGRTAGGYTFDPEKLWSNEMRQAYEDNILPQFWICPFSRGKGAGEVFVREDAKFKYWEWQGRHEHYQTWLWRPIYRGTEPGGTWPGGPGNAKRGVVQYSNITWNAIPENGAGVNEPEFKNTRHRKWETQDARKARSASLADLTAMFCAQGEHMVYSGSSSKLGRVNVGSHRTFAGGGTNAIFADGHVEWVLGSRIGWP